MSFQNYLKEKWVTYLFIVAAFLFSVIVYFVDKRLTMSNSNASYILLGWSFLFIIFVGADYTIFHFRFKKMKNFFLMNGSNHDEDEFYYPTDYEYANLVNKLVVEFELYKAEISTKSTEEIEFITKWLHDVKIPISASRLILENHEDEVSKHFYQSMETELFSIEQSVQQVFYEMKSNSFFSDYRIALVNTNKLITNSLKSYVNFFSYKKLKIEIVGESYEVLSDEKWSSYIISQIISNAVKHTPIGGSITISTDKNERRTTISIKNSGKGIPKKDINQIFNKGYTSSDNRKGMKATGYGLYLSKKLSDLLGHQLNVTSEYGKYANFELTFIESDTIYNVTKM